MAGVVSQLEKTPLIPSKELSDSALQLVVPVADPPVLAVRSPLPSAAAERPDVPELTVPKEMVCANAGANAPIAATDDRAAKSPKVWSLFIYSS